MKDKMSELGLSRLVTLQREVHPPSTDIAAPVMKGTSSLARKRIALAISSGLAARFCGTDATRRRWYSFWPSPEACASRLSIGVSRYPGRSHLRESRPSHGRPQG